MSLSAIILAAGRGSRLTPITPGRSKAMAPIAGKPLIGRVLDCLQNLPITTWIVVMQPRDAELAEWITSTLPSAHLVHQVQPLGAGDALKQAAPFACDTSIVTACDSLLPPNHLRDLLNATHSEESFITLSVMQVAPQESLARRSVVRLEGNRVLDLIEKPTDAERFSDFTSLPCYVVRKPFFRSLEQLSPTVRGEYEIQDAIRAAIRSGEHVVSVPSDHREEVTTLDDLLALNLHYLQQSSGTLTPTSAVFRQQGVQIVGHCYIEQGAHIEHGAVVGPNVLVERGARIGANAIVANAIVLRGASVLPNSTIRGRAVV